MNVDTTDLEKWLTDNIRSNGSKTDIHVYSVLMKAILKTINNPVPVDSTPQPVEVNDCPFMFNERFADNGEHSHWTVINKNDGETVWSEDAEEISSPLTAQEDKTEPQGDFVYCMHCSGTGYFPSNETVYSCQSTTPAQSAPQTDKCDNCDGTDQGTCDAYGEKWCYDCMRVAGLCLNCNKDIRFLVEDYANYEPDLCPECEKKEKAISAPQEVAQGAEGNPLNDKL
jgi:hypothetical protein